MHLIFSVNREGYLDGFILIELTRTKANWVQQIMINSHIVTDKHFEKGNVLKRELIDRTEKDDCSVPANLSKTATAALLIQDRGKSSIPVPVDRQLRPVEPCELYEPIFIPSLWKRCRNWSSTWVRSCCVTFVSYSWAHRSIVLWGTTFKPFRAKYLSKYATASDKS